VCNDEDGTKHGEHDDVTGVSQLEAPVSGNLRNDSVPDADQHQNRHVHHYVDVLQRHRQNTSNNQLRYRRLWLEADYYDYYYAEADLQASKAFL